MDSATQNVEITLRETPRFHGEVAQIEYLTTREVCTKTRLSRQTVLKLIHTGKLEAIRPTGERRGKYLIPVAALDKWLKSCS